MAIDTFKQFVNKDGYAKGGIPVEESPQILVLDPISWNWFIILFSKLFF